MTDDYGYNRADAGLVRSGPRMHARMQGGLRLGRRRCCSRSATAGRRFNSVDIDRRGGRRAGPRGRARAARATAALPGRRHGPAVRTRIVDLRSPGARGRRRRALFPAWECPTDTPSRPAIRCGSEPAASPSRSRALKVYRDIYYTRGRRAERRRPADPARSGRVFRAGRQQPRLQRRTELGRRGAIKQSQLIGKPLVVHLPSRPGRVHASAGTHATFAFLISAGCDIFDSDVGISGCDDETRPEPSDKTKLSAARTNFQSHPEPDPTRQHTEQPRLSWQRRQNPRGRRPNPRGPRAQEQSQRLESRCAARSRPAVGHAGNDRVDRRRVRPGVSVQDVRGGSLRDPHRLDGSHASGPQQGGHCPKCGTQFTIGASDEVESETDYVIPGARITRPSARIAAIASAEGPGLQRPRLQGGPHSGHEVFV